MVWQMYSLHNQYLGHLQWSFQRSLTWVFGTMFFGEECGLFSLPYINHNSVWGTEAYSNTVACQFTLRVFLLYWCKCRQDKSTSLHKTTSYHVQELLVEEWRIVNDILWRWRELVWNCCLVVWSRYDELFCPIEGSGKCTKKTIHVDALKYM